MAIIIYFSHTGENLISGKLTYIETGNTKIVAKKISEQLNGMKYMELVPQSLYPDVYKKTVEIAEVEKREQKYVAYQKIDIDFAEHEEIFLGYPNWCGTIPRIVASFLEDNKMDNKKIYPFCTHEGSNLGNSVNDIKKSCPNAQILQRLPVRGTNANKSDTAIKNWLIQYQLNRKQ